MEAVARAYMRWKLPRTEKERKKALEEALETVTYYAQRNDSHGLPAAAVLFNIGLHLLLAERDIQAIKIDALTHPDEWTRKLHTRTIAMTIYEWKFDNVTGQALRKALELIDTPDELKAEITAALRHLRKVQERVESHFGMLRNKTIAHRDPDALLVYRAIRDLKTMEVIHQAADFYEGVSMFLRALTKVMNHSSSFDSILRQWSARQLT